MGSKQCTGKAALVSLYGLSERSSALQCGCCNRLILRVEAHNLETSLTESETGVSAGRKVSLGANV